MFNDFDSKIKLGTTNNTLWDPIWKISTKMSDVEEKIFSLDCIKRLHFIHHGGSSYLNTHYIHTRLQHTIGVYSLVSYFHKDNINLKIAALLHDVGHAPFSHTVEKIDGVDHHKWTEEIITNSKVNDILKEYHISSNSIIDLINGVESSILTNKTGNLHLDHLDSWVRSAYASGTLMVTPSEILNKLKVVNGYIQTDEEMAKVLFDIILDEAKLHCSFSSITTNAVIKTLVEKLIDSKSINIIGLKIMLDSQLEYLLLNNNNTKSLAKKLWFQIDKFKILKNKNNLKSNYIDAEVKKLYLSMPLVNDIPFDVLSSDAKEKINEAKKLIGKYYIYIDS